jgi:hypothetical protein
MTNPANTALALERVKEYHDAEQRRHVRNAQQAITAAREELANIERQLLLANEGQPYTRVGGVRGLDLSAVSLAFSSIENAAWTLRLAQTAEEHGLVEGS